MKQVQSLKYVKNVSCVDQSSFVQNIMNVPVAVADLPVGARLHQLWATWAALRASSKVIRILREGNTLLFRIRPNSTRSLTIISRYVHPFRNSYLIEALHGLMQKNVVELDRTQESLGFFNRLLFVIKTKQRMETYLGPQYSEQISSDRESGNTRDYKDISNARGVDIIHGPQGHLLPHSNTHQVQGIPTFSHSRSIQPFQSTTIWSVHSTNGIHGGGEGGQSDCFTEG